MDPVTLGMAKAAAKKDKARLGGGIAYWGDSITAAMVQTSGNLRYSSIESPMAWAQHLSGYRFFPATNAGVAGDRTDQALARFATVSAAAPRVVVIECGTNDAVQDVPAATIQTNLTTMVTRAQGLGASVIVSGIPPRNALTAAQRIVRNTVNRWLADNAASLGYVYVNVDGTLTDTGSSQQYLANHSQDGTHPNGAAALKWGTLIANALKTLTPPTDIIPSLQYDPKLLSNSMQQLGSGSAPGAGFTGVLSTGWGCSAIGGTVTGTTSKVARTDGLTGEWQSINITAQSVETAGARMQLNTSSGFVAGTDTVYAFAEYELGSDVTIMNDLSINLATVAPGSVVVQQVQAMSNTAGGIATTAHRNLYASLSAGRKGILITERVLIDPTATASLNMELRFYGLGTIKWGRAGVMKV
jgi:lysophospholipase L1-like esterase